MERRPLVLVAGVKSELPADDTLTGGVATGYIELTSSQTWAIPPEATWLWIEVVAAGGGGRSSTYSSLRSGGSGGQCVRTLLRAQDMPASVSVVVGAGGAGTSGTVTANDGGDSSFGAITALGGRGGIDGCTLPKTFSTTYSSSTANPILSFYDAGGSVYAASQIKTVYGGGGGGESSAAGISQFHGNGGFGSAIDADGHAGNGVFPGGGGGGRAYSTSALRKSGAGANGTCKIWWW